MVCKDPDVGRARDRERFARRIAERRAAGLCPRCGQRPPALDRSVCEACAEKRRTSERARDARLRAAGKPRRDPEKARASERRRYRRQVSERQAEGLCTCCGKAPAVPERAVCEDCGKKRREAERIRYAAGKPYGGRDPDARRRGARARSGKREQARRKAGLCTRCGRRPPVEGGTACAPCREARRAAERGLYAARRSEGLCGRCGQPAFAGESRCAPCAALEAERGSPERKNAAARRRYAERRARGICTDCGGASQGAARCRPCADRSYERSGYFRGIPVWDPSYIVIERATGREHGPFDSEADVALCLAFARLSRDQVEIVADAPITASLTGWT